MGLTNIVAREKEPLTQALFFCTSWRKKRGTPADVRQDFNDVEMANEMQIKVKLKQGSHPLAF